MLAEHLKGPFYSTQVGIHDITGSFAQAIPLLWMLQQFCQGRLQ